ncbi:MAG: DUF6493 family protein, partial [Planctomycetota bacterium]
MNVDALKSLIVQADRQTLCERLGPLSEAARAMLFPDALAIYRTVDAGEFLQPGDSQPIGLEAESWFDPNFLAALRTTQYPDWRCPRWTASLMMLGLADQAFLNSPSTSNCGWLHSDLRDMPHRVLEVLSARRPKWLAEFVARQIKNEFTFIAWSVEFGLLRDGVLSDFQADSFYKRMAIYPLMGEHFASDAVKSDQLAKQPRTLADAIRAEPSVLKAHIWQLFEFDTGAFNYTHSPWFEALKTLCHDGDLERSRLLRVSADALGRPFRPKELAGFGKLHESLEPSIPEREGLLDSYQAALHTEHSAVAGHALRAFESLAKSKRLSAGSFLDHVEDVLRLPQKTQPVKAIKLIRMLIKQEPSAAPKASEVIAIALTHEKPDVQEVGLKEIESLHDHFTTLTIERINEAKTSIASALKPRLEALVCSKDAGPSAKLSPDHSATTKAVESSGGDAQRDEALHLEIKGLEQRLHVISEEIRTACEAGRAVAAIGDASGNEPLHVHLCPALIPRRDASADIQVIGSL